MKVYEKIGKRYHELGFQFTGFPSDGIWLVQDGKQNMICLIRSDEKVPVRALEYRVHSNELTKYLVDKFRDTPHSWDDISRACCDFFAEMEARR
jgi:hypothetical protein